MKNKYYKNSDFSNKFNKLTLTQIINPKKENDLEIDFVRLGDLKIVTCRCERGYRTKLIKPQRFVWHLSEKSKRFDIARSGLLIEKRREKLIYANNSNYVPSFYPFCYDVDLINSYSEYDFWKIDTYSFDAEWEIDSHMANDSWWTTDKTQWICTKSNIPAISLKLFNHIGHNNWIDGYGPDPNSHFSRLRPVEKINDHIDFVNRVAA